MNYRHIYHAGNIGDVLKHMTLAAIIHYLTRKPAAFRVIDTHAGIGLYDLASEEAQKTGEWQTGIGRVLAAPVPADIQEFLAPWLSVVQAVNGTATLTTYPGSPEIARRLLRKQDRLTLTELHPTDFATLAARYEGDFQVKTIELDGWLALGGFLPPKERRGMVVIDPAFEETDEFGRLADGLIRGWKRWQSGIFLAWYPVKDRAAVERFHARMADSGVRDILVAELSAGRAKPDGPMRSSSIMIVNPPWGLRDGLSRALPWLAAILKEDPAARDHDAGWQLRDIVEE